MKTPQGWRSVRLRYLCEINPAARRIAGPIAFAPMDAVGVLGGIRFEQTLEQTDVSSGLSYFEENDVIVAKITPCFENGKCALAENVPGGRALGSTEFHVIRPGPAVFPRFLFYTCVSGAFRELGEARMYGAAGQKRVPTDFVKDFSLSFPERPAQRAIAEFLDRETSKIDSLLAQKQRMVHLLDEKRTALISRAVMRGIDSEAAMKDSGVEWMGEVPAHWKEHRLSGLADFISGSTPTIDRLDYWGGDIFWVSPKDMKVSHLSQTEDCITDTALREWGMVLVQPPAVLLVVRGMILLHSLPVAVSQVPMTINQDMKALLVRPGCLAEFLMHWFQGSKHGLASLIEQSAHGTRCLRTDLLRQVRCFLPEPEEQTQICDYINGSCAALGETANRMSRAIDRLREYRSTLITAAVTGQVDISAHEKSLEVLA